MPKRSFWNEVASQLNKADPNAVHSTLRTFGTLGVLRHEIRDRGTRFSLYQFKPEHDLNPETLERCKNNRLRVVPELVYSPWATDAHLEARGGKAKAWRIDLVLFVNGIPVATLELKSEFKQAVHWLTSPSANTRPTWPLGSKATTRIFSPSTKTAKMARYAFRLSLVL